MAAALVSGLSAIAACGSDKPATNSNPFGAAGAAGAVTGTSGAAGATAPMAGAGGAAPTAGAAGASTAGATSVAGAAGQSTAGAGGAGGAGGAVGSAGSGGAAANPITGVAKTAGCGLDPVGMNPGQTSGMLTIQTSGTKPAGCADSSCGAWSYTRNYYVTLPSGYDKNKAYPLVFLGPGCGGNGSGVYALQGPTGPNADNTVIKVGITPPPNAIGHATNPNQGCFDDKEGDDSVDWVFYENLWDKLAGQICFDKNRVFAGGDSSGAWFGNEVGCKYAGDPTHPIRGIMPNTGGLPTEAKYVPTCTNKPMAGMWVGETMDPENSFAGNVVAINRAIKVNGCTGGDWPTTPTANYPIGGGKPDTTCKQITGCPSLYPLVVCLIPGNQHASHTDTTNPGFVTFLKYFQKAPQLTTP